ncbi:DUF1631 family protein [Ramlibacter tataouinensis]|uniref:Thymidine phosphorylase n=1 Tax=Ramlibacter tataouinensis (strain ATCC BAA-407 / DSM 14655 / LMG 21543 / TTB310) TaxID=365046 RepID=F5Y124_RAMTT|nr:DUF1631 family protein [Ramlibacter tataouinensis]AEG92242.1 conserved hypothetical protein [Ramlibacter tataouinensis TTB310]
MAKLLKLRLGVSDDPTALQPTLADCLQALLSQSEPLMAQVIEGLQLAAAPAGPRRIPGFQQPGIQRAVQALAEASAEVRARYTAELGRLVYEGGGKEQAQTEALRFEDLQLFGDEELDQSIEVARAQQEVSQAVDDVLPALDALISTLLGWRTIQSGLNPLRPDVFVRALQACLAAHVPDPAVREALIVPAAGLLGAQLRQLYRELTDWLASSGVEPAMPVGGKAKKGLATGTAVASSVAKTLLTLDRLRKLLAGDFDTPPRQDYQHTLPASMALLQDMKQVDALVRQLEERSRGEPPAPPRDLLEPAPAEGSPRLGRQLGKEVVRLMFDNLTQDSRLVREYKNQLKAIEPAVLRLAQYDSRFFSDRSHPARQLLDRMTQRSLAFTNESDPGWQRFLATVQAAVKWLDSKVIDADTFAELLETLQAQWGEQDQNGRQRREDGARALLHAEQRHLLAQKLAGEFAQEAEGLGVPEFVGDFLKGSWSQVVAEAKLSCVDGSDDPYGYRALVADLVWSVQKSTAQRSRLARLAQMIPGLLERLREGLDRIDYPPELTGRFFENLTVVHQSALQEGRDAQAREAAEAAEAQPSQLPDSVFDDAAIWLAEGEAAGTGYLQPEAGAQGAPAQGPEQPPAAPGELRTGAWVELMVKGEWLRVQLTWASPHHTLFMFTSPAGTAHSMSRRMLDRLRAQGLMKVIADRNVVDEALDQVAKTALLNSLDGKT